MSIFSRIALHDGTSIPALGLGFYLTETGGETRSAGLYAVEKGYRLLDTATLYDNEEEVGQVVRDCGLPRDQLYVTTKLWYTDHGRANTTKAFNTSLKKYIDNVSRCYMF